MVKCTFCGKDESSIKGIHIMMNNGDALYFHSSKCRKNYFNLKRDKRKVRWTEAFHVSREKARDREKAKEEKASLIKK